LRIELVDVKHGDGCKRGKGELGHWDDSEEEFLGRCARKDGLGRKKTTQRRRGR
jgi:hypothetical protein